MNYKKIYDSICNRAKLQLKDRIERKKTGEYYEGHHIVPKCLGGTGWPTQVNHPNIVLVTAREHFLCHWLLHEMYPNDYKLAKAFQMICSIKDKNQPRYTPSSRVIEYAKLKSSELHSLYMKNVFWTDDMKQKMSEKHTGKKHSEEVKKIISKRIKESITEESKIEMSRRVSGDLNPSKRKSVRLKMSQSAKNRPSTKCPHCNKVGPINQMKQWHFDYCKNKLIN